MCLFPSGIIFIPRTTVEWLLGDNIFYNCGFGIKQGTYAEFQKDVLFGHKYLAEEKESSGQRDTC